MVRKYIKKSRRRMWSTEAMKMAIEAVIKQGLSIKKASIENEVPQATLSRKIHQCRCDPDKSIDLVMHPKASNFQTVFTKEQELILCQYINMLEDQLVGLTTIDIRRLAFQVAEKLRIPHRFNRDIETAGEDWYRGFLKRNPRVTLKRVDHLSEKNRELNENRVYQFFDLLEGTINKYDLKASDVYNVDETVITCLPKYDSNIESIELEEFASAEQNKLVTAVICLCANGDHLPLLLIFPCLNKCKTLVKGAPPGAWAEFHPTGQMHLSIFIKWLKKFIHFSKATRDSPVLLILDGYRSYLKDLQVLEIIQENGVNVMCVPSQFGDKLQPIRLNFMTCLSKTYSSELMKWIRSNPNCIVSMNEIYQHFGNAFLKVLKIATPASCFRDTGIWPVDRNLLNKDVDRSAKTESPTKEKSKS
ncbi:PREDICTED: uncharacterized protein LOC105361249 [Ceratosolen solmsi marchali]|uniref:Uncharacterized protein LOC105361249 n=1 Tax=Ceratosolen solmsi marchali TaxID=326594 RepID=A0AAJ6YEM6_9HYME|nr:PREDICTED: uncharacterized protein LOC105361249 [Ceratosolen solmsi marchali]